MVQARNDIITPVVFAKSDASREWRSSTYISVLLPHEVSGVTFHHQTMPLQINTAAIHTKSIAARKLYSCFAQRDNQWSSYKDLALSWCDLHGQEPSIENMIEADRDVRNGKKAVVDHCRVDGLCGHDASIDSEGCDSQGEHVICVQKESRMNIAHRFRINPKVAEHIFLDSVSEDGENAEMDLDADDNEDVTDSGHENGDEDAPPRPENDNLESENDSESRLFIEDDSENEVMSLDTNNCGYGTEDGTITLDDYAAESVMSSEADMVMGEDAPLLDNAPEFGNELGNEELGNVVELAEPEPAPAGAWYQSVTGLVRSIQDEVGQMFAHFNGRQNQTEAQVVQIADQIATQNEANKTQFAAHDAQIRTLTQALQGHTQAQKQNQTQNPAPHHISHSHQDPQPSSSTSRGTYYADIIKQCYGLANVHANTILSENGARLTHVMRPMGWLVGEKKTRCVNQQRLILPQYVDEFKMRLKEQFPAVVCQNRVHQWRETI